MKHLIISLLAIGIVVVAVSAAHATWVCEQYCSDFMRMTGSCLADRADTSRQAPLR